jgi:hypothetical protein
MDMDMSVVLAGCAALSAKMHRCVVFFHRFVRRNGRKYLNMENIYWFLGF